MPRATSLIATAVLVTLAGAASAQANVTVFGLLDVTAGRFTGAPTGVNAQDEATFRVNSGGMSTSHFGLRGSEDLGGGLAASFELATFIRNDTGAAGRSDAIPAPVNVAADPFWSRAAWVGVGSSTLGRVRVGNATTLMFLNSILSNPFGDSTVFSPINLVTFIGAPLSGGTGWTDSIVYDSPNLSGLSLHAQHSLGERPGGHNTGLRAAYSRGPWAASLAWQNVEKDPQTFADGTSPNDTRAWQLAASYDFQVVKLFAHLGRIRNKGTEAAPLDVGYRIWELSASVPVGTGRLLAGHANRKTGDAVGPVPATVAGGNVERAVLTVGYDHPLSRRTDLYAMATNDKTKTNTLPGPPTVVSASATNVGVGIRHRF